jgi:hypothetical protein
MNGALEKIPTQVKSVTEQGPKRAPVKVRMRLSSRDFLGEEFYRFAAQDLESMNRFRNEVSARRPDEAEKLILKINKPWINFYNNLLSDVKEM